MISKESNARSRKELVKMQQQRELPSAVSRNLKALAGDMGALLVVSSLVGCTQDDDAGVSQPDNAVPREISADEAYLVDKMTPAEYETVYKAFGNTVTKCMEKTGETYIHPPSNQYTGMEPDLGFAVFEPFGEAFRIQPMLFTPSEVRMTSLGAPSDAIPQDKDSPFHDWAKTLAGGYPPRMLDTSSCYAHGMKSLNGSLESRRDLGLGLHPLHTTVNQYMIDGRKVDTLMEKFPQRDPGPNNRASDELAAPLRQPWRTREDTYTLPGGLSACYDDETFIKTLYEMYEEAYGAVAKARPELFERVDRLKKDALKRAKEMN